MPLSKSGEVYTAMNEMQAELRREIRRRREMNN
jgi:hypothetical protein